MLRLKGSQILEHAKTVDTRENIYFKYFIQWRHFVVKLYILMSNACATSPDGYSECGYTKATSNTCTSFKKTLNDCTL